MFKRKTAAFAVLSLSILLACSSVLAQSSQPAPGEYARAIYKAVQWKWAPRSASGDLVPGSACAARIVQLPGGEVLAVDFYPECEFAQEGREAIKEVVLSSSPLPYRGFEDAFQRELRMVFRAATLEDRHALIEQQASSRRVAEDSAASDSKWAVDVERRERMDRYVLQCSRHIASNTPKAALKQLLMIDVEVDHSGRVVSVPYVGRVRKDGSVARVASPDRSLIGALKSTPPCAPVSSDLTAGASGIEVGPIMLGPADG